VESIYNIELVELESEVGKQVTFKRGQVLDYIDNIVDILASACKVSQMYEKKVVGEGMHALKEAGVNIETLGARVSCATEKEKEETIKELIEKSKDVSFDFAQSLVATTLEELNEIKMKAINLDVPSLLVDRHHLIIQTVSDICAYFEYVHEYLTTGGELLLEVANRHMEDFNQGIILVLEYIEFLEESMIQLSRKRLESLKK